MRIEIQTIDEFGNFFLENENSEILLLYGGAGAGKSYSTAIWLLEKALKERNKRF